MFLCNNFDRQSALTIWTHKITHLLKKDLKNHCATEAFVENSKILMETCLRSDCPCQIALYLALDWMKCTLRLSNKQSQRNKHWLVIICWNTNIVQIFVLLNP